MHRKSQDTSKVKHEDVKEEESFTQRADDQSYSLLGDYGRDRAIIEVRRETTDPAVSDGALLSDRVNIVEDRTDSSIGDIDEGAQAFKPIGNLKHQDTGKVFTKIEVQIDNSNTAIKYGDIIFIENLTHSKDQEMIMVSKGTTDLQINFKTLEQLSQEQVDQSRCYFQILPPVDFSTETELRNQTSYMRKILKNPEQGKIELQELMNKDILNTDVFDRITQLDRNIISNCKVYKELIGTPVKYGQSILLLHTYSGMFLEMNDEEGHLIQNKLNLSDKKKEIEKHFSLLTAFKKKKQQTLSLSRALSTMYKESYQISADETHSNKFTAYLAPYISEKTIFQFEEFSLLQKSSKGYVCNKDLFFLMHQSNNLSFYAQIFNGKILFEEHKTTFFLRKAKQQMKNEEDQQSQQLFRGLNNQYVWLSHAHDKLYLNVREVYTRGNDTKPLSPEDSVINIGKKDNHNSPSTPKIRSPGILQSPLPIQKIKEASKKIAQEISVQPLFDEDHQEERVSKFQLKKKRMRVQAAPNIPVDNVDSSEERKEEEDKNDDKAQSSDSSEDFDRQVDEGSVHNERELNPQFLKVEDIPNKLVRLTSRDEVSIQKEKLMNQQFKIYFKHLKKTQKIEDNQQVIEEYIRQQHNNDKSEDNQLSDDLEDDQQFSKRAVWMIEFKKVQKEDSNDDMNKNDENEDDDKQQYKIYFKNIFHLKYLAIRAGLLEQEQDVEKFNADGNKIQYDSDFYLYLSDQPSEKNCGFDIKFLKREKASQDFQNDVQLARITKTIGNKSYILCVDNNNQFHVNVKDKRCVLEVFNDSTKHWNEYRDVFQIISLSKDEIWNLNFLTQKKQFFETGIKDDFQIPDLARTLKQLDLYVQNKLDGRINVHYKYGEVIKERQNELRAFNIIYFVILYLELVLEKSKKRKEHLGYYCIKKIFKIVKLMTIGHVHNQLNFFENFDGMKDFISNSRKICQIIQSIVEDSHLIIRKLVIPTYDVPQGVLDLDEKDQLFKGDKSNADFEDKKDDQPTGELANIGSINDTRKSRRGTVKLMGLVLQSAQNPFPLLQDEGKINMQSIMNFFVEKITKNAEEKKYHLNIIPLQILQTYMIPVDEGIFWNQWYLFKKFITKYTLTTNGDIHEFKPKAFIPIYVNKKTKKLYFDQPGLFTINDQHKNDRLKSKTNKIVAFQEQLRFYACLCASQNYISINYFTKFLSFEALLAFLEECIPGNLLSLAQLLLELKPDVIRLIRVIHIETNSENLVKLPKTIKYPKKEEGSSSKSQKLDKMNSNVGKGTGFNTDNMQFLIGYMCEHFLQFDKQYKANLTEQQEPQTKNRRTETDQGKMNEELLIVSRTTQEYLLLIERLLCYDSKFFSRPLIKKTLTILQIALQMSFKAKQQPTLIKYNFQQARMFEKSRYLDEFYLHKLFKGETNDEYLYLFTQNDSENSQSNIEMKQQLALFLTKPTIVTKIQYIKLLTSQIDQKDDLTLNNNKNLNVIFDILNRILAYKKNIFIDLFMQEYYKLKAFKDRGDISKKVDNSKTRQSVEGIIADCMDSVNSKFRTILFPKLDVRFKGQKVDLRGNFGYSTKCDVKINSLIMSNEQETQQKMFLELFYGISDIEVQNKLIELFFNVIYEPQMNLESLKNVIVVTEQADIQRYKEIKSNLQFLRKIHLKSEIWLYNQFNFEQSSGKVFKALNKLYESLNAKNQGLVAKKFYQDIFMQLGGDELIISMIKEYKGYIQLIIQSDNSRLDLEQLYTGLFKILQQLFDRNEDYRAKYMEQIEIFYPLAPTKNFGEFKLVYKLMKSNKTLLNHYQLQQLSNYISSCIKDLKVVNEEISEANDQIMKVTYLFKLIQIIIYDQTIISEKTVNVILQFVQIFTLDKIQDQKQLKIYNLMLKLCSSMIEQKHFKSNHLQKLEEIFQFNVSNIDNLFRKMNEKIESLVHNDSNSSSSLDVDELNQLQLLSNGYLRQLLLNLYLHKFSDQQRRQQFIYLIQQHFLKNIMDEVEFVNEKRLKNITNQLQQIQGQITDTKYQKEFQLLMQNIKEKKKEFTQVNDVLLTLTNETEVVQNNESNVKGRKQNSIRNQQSYRLDKTTLLHIEDDIKKYYKAHSQEASRFIMDSIFKNEKEEEYKILTQIKKMIDVLQIDQSEDYFNQSNMLNILALLSSKFDDIKDLDQPDATKTHMIQEFQKNLSCMDLVQIILDSMCNSNQLTFTTQVDQLNTLNKMLMEGSQVIQDKIYEYFINHRKTENLIDTLAIILKDSTKKLNDFNKEIKIVEFKKLLMIPNILEIKSTKTHLNINLLENVILFMKQLCEGHHTNHQNYLREQVNNQNSSNLILLLIRLLDELIQLILNLKLRIEQDFKESISLSKSSVNSTFSEGMNLVYDSIFNTANSCLITLLEIIQGPNIENQNLLLTSKFKDIADKILDMKFLSTHKNKTLEYKTQMQFYDCHKYDYQIQRLKANVIIIYQQLKQMLFILIEMLFGSEKEDNIIKIQQFFQISELENAITEFYKLLIANDIYYGNNLFFNVNLFYLQSLQLNKSSEQIFEAVYVKSQKVTKRRSTEQDSWIIMEVGINAFILREIIYKPQTVVIKSFLSNKNFFFTDFVLIKALLQYLQLFLKFLISFVLSFTCCRNYRLLRKDQEDKLKNEALSFFKSNIRSIEIFKDDRKETIYFPKLPICNNKTEQLKNQLIYDVDRTSHKAKVESLMNFQEDIVLEMESNQKYYENRLFQKVRCLQVIAKSEEFMKDSAFYFLIGLHLHILLQYNGFGIVGKIEDIPEMQDMLEVTQILVKIMVAFAVFIFFFVVLKRVITMSFKNAYKDDLKLRKKLQRQTTSQFKSKESVVVRMGASIEKSNAYKVTTALLTDQNFLYYLSYIAMAFLAIFVHPFFIAYHLMDIVVRSKILKNVLYAIYEPREQLIILLFLFLVVEYIFSLFAYAYMPTEFPDTNCSDSLLQCWLIIIDQTFKNDGGVGSYMIPGYNQNNEDIEAIEGKQQNTKNDWTSYDRVVFDNIFNLIILILLVEMVSGLVIDTFSKLREKQEVIDEDIKNRCFICGMSRDDVEKMEKSKNAFQDHIKKKHNQWNYIFYLCYLKQKPKSEYSGIESYLDNMIIDQDNSWFPNLSVVVD